MGRIHDPFADPGGIGALIFHLAVDQDLESSFRLIKLQYKRAHASRSPIGRAQGDVSLCDGRLHGGRPHKTGLPIAVDLQHQPFLRRVTSFEKVGLFESQAFGPFLRFILLKPWPAGLLFTDAIPFFQIHTTQGLNHSQSLVTK